ncbi:hypothetical protein GGS20DRAFT_477476 [Poronia punctata]|nr:hypothetical protein GGS20DRAFT_477476 [Poronia punctata]
MKWAATIVSLGLIASNVIAAPLESEAKDDLNLFNLKISAPNNPELDGRYLSQEGSDVGLYEGDPSPIRVYKTSSQKKGRNQLHTYPIGIVDHALGLVGPPDFMTLTDMINPARVKPKDGEVAVWDTFVISHDRLTNDGRGAWLAFPAAESSWRIKWSDGSAFTTEDYMPVEVLMEKEGEGRYNM